MKKAALTLSLAALALLALAQATYPLVITKLETKDEGGNLKAVFRRGEVVVIETEVSVAAAYYYYYTAPISYLQIITMWCGNSKYGLLLTRATISAGETKTFGGGVWIRQADPIGAYRIEVYVWNGFPSEKGAAWAPLAEKRVATISIAG